MSASVSRRAIRRVSQILSYSGTPKFAPARHSSTSNAQSSTANGQPSQNTTPTLQNQDQTTKSTANETASNDAPKKKSVLQQDEELRQEMSGLSGDGGESGIEYEDGKPVSMKRSVKNNMFRYI